MKEIKLTEKQERFIDYYIETGNATEAARRAGYSEKTAKQIGSENLTKLDFFIKERLKELEDVRIAKADEVLKHLTAAIRGEIEEEVVVVESIGDGESRARIIKKQISAKERIRAAELLGKRYALFTEKLDVDVDVGTEKLDSILKQLKEDWCYGRRIITSGNMQNNGGDYASMEQLLLSKKYKAFLKHDAPVEFLEGT